MKRIEIEQGTKEWHKWRKSLITATDCPAIMGSSPWVTPFKCWQKKLGLVEDKKPSKAMEEGIRLEPEARALFVQEFGLPMEPACVESDEFSILGASLDGITPDNKFILEIKCGGEDLHNQAAHGIVPDYYLDQIQQQLLVTGADKCFYYSYRNGEGICIDVFPDPDFMERFIPVAREFWKGIAFFEPPPLTNKDYLDRSDNISWKEYTDIYIEADKMEKASKEKKEYARKKLIEMCDDQSCQGAGLKVMKMIMKGRVDYEKIPEIESIDLDKYRKASTTSWKVLVEKS